MLSIMRCNARRVDVTSTFPRLESLQYLSPTEQYQKRSLFWLKKHRQMQICLRMDS
jgi:hypothetical protein